jgi:hypothetical protein
MEWEPFSEAYKPLPGLKALKRDYGISKDEAKRIQEYLRHDAVYLNNIYEVEVTAVDVPDWPPVKHLSIKRRDKEAIHDWRHLQRIKNEICGPEAEAVELYPAESRLLDGANQYHLWCVPPGYNFPFGFTTGGKPVRSRPEDAARVGAKQRPFEDFEKGI